MGISIKVIGVEDFHHSIYRLVFNEDASQYGLFRFDMLRRKFV